ncbi:receptor-like protein EIX2 [Pistacia vera]|uniref:receptor-like protein EIX2 n=1 Tax=Pistacia vera TaxID=55513 RepID=UPI001263B707|nr:receptor-like protein EIX2 [Pistacia vera]
MSIFLAFLFISTTLNISFCGGSSYRGCIESERQALLRFKKDLIDHSNRLASWTSGHGDCCTWSGIFCDNQTGHVLELNLSTPEFNFNSFDEAESYYRSRLGGKVNPSLLDLKHLRSLDLSNNNLSGIQIPKFLCYMHNLRYLDLSENSFQGIIPHQLGNLSNLQHLALDGCIGIIPHQLGNLSNLQHLALRGSLDVDNLGWLSSLSLLKHLDLSYVDLSKSSDWLHVINTLPSLVVLNLRRCGIHHFPQLPIVNFSFLETLDLSDNNFEGPIPYGLQKLTSLRYLDLSENYFNSSIPNWIYRLSRLQGLPLDNNWLKGTLGILGNLTSIEELDLSFNGFEGGIPKSMGRLCNLRSITISYVNLSQPISDVFDIFSRCVSDVLEILDLSESQVFGQFTDRLGQFKKLKSLNLFKNSISGSIPSSLGELSSLQVLDVIYNKLNGTVSEMHFSNLTRLLKFNANENSLIFQVNPHWVPPFKLTNLGLRSCHLGPQFPLWLRSQKHLQYLDISDSRIKDAIPTFLFKIPFKYVNLSHNQLYGQIPNLTESTQLEVLDLNSNNLSGSMPLISFQLHLLDLSNNVLSGPIFHFLCHKLNESKSLEILILNNNYLSEVIPDCWMNLKVLRVLNLANNRFTGKLPASIGNLSSLQLLKLRKNNFSGTIPMSLKNCTDMVSLDLGENEFVGNLKAWVGERFSKMKILNLRSNKFSGHLPKELCDLRSLQILDLADNNFFGTIPRCINNFSAMMTKSSNEESDMSYETFESTYVSTYLEGELLVNKGHMVEYNTILKFVRGIDLSKNNFFGQIPMEVTNLSELQSLNLSHNGFTGRIPEKIGAMRSLESIDFSRNQLSGEIPQSISSLTFLSNLNLSNNNLTGRIPSSTQLSGFDASCFTGNQLCGPPLPNNCTVTSPTINNQNRGEKDGNEDEVNWFFVSMALGFIVGFWSFIGSLLVSRRWRYLYCQFLNNLQDKLGSVVRKCY